VVQRKREQIAQSKGLNPELSADLSRDSIRPVSPHFQEEQPMPYDYTADELTKLANVMNALLEFNSLEHCDLYLQGTLELYYNIGDGDLIGEIVLAEDSPIDGLWLYREKSTP